MPAAAASAEAFTPTGVCADPLIPGDEIRIARIAYDARDRMVSVTAPGVSATYAYGTDNLRVRMNDGGGDRRVLLDGIEEMAEYEAAGTRDRVARFEHDPSRVDALLAQVGSGGKVAVLTDALGSVYGLVDASGASQARYSYDAFGARTAAVETEPTRVGFTGREHDPSGLMYYRARYYDPTGAHFVQPDPQGMIDGPNTYLYVSGRPTALTDPFGLSVRVFCETVDSTGENKKWWETVGLFFIRPKHCFVVVKCDDPDACGSDYPKGLSPPFNASLEIQGPLQADGTASPEMKTPPDQGRGEEIPVGRWATGLGVGTLYGVSGRCKREACVMSRYQYMIKHQPKYNYAGPNSNTFAFKLLLGCGMWAFMPDDAYGWDAEVTY